MAIGIKKAPTTKASGQTNKSQTALADISKIRKDPCPPYKDQRTPSQIQRNSLGNTHTIQCQETLQQRLPRHLLRPVLPSTVSAPIYTPCHDYHDRNALFVICKLCSLFSFVLDVHYRGCVRILLLEFRVQYTKDAIRKVTMEVH